MKSTRSLPVPLLVAIALPLAASAGGVWSRVHSEFKDGEPSRVEGPDAAYEVVRPPAGPWRAMFRLSNHFANLEDYSIDVYAADTITFHDYFIASGHSGMSSALIFKLNLSEPVRRVTWALPNHSRDLTMGASLAARYSVDGERWSAAYRYPPGRSDVPPPPAVLAFDPPRQTIYIGWFADVPAGEGGYWNVGETGTLTFLTDDHELPHPAAGSTSGPAGLPGETCRDLQGPRLISNDFFATTTHGVDENIVAALRALNIPGARIDAMCHVEEPAPGQRRLTMYGWCVDNADRGTAAGIDLLPILHPPSLAFDQPGEKTNQLVEQYAFETASRYRGRIRAWQIGNEPNMAAWRERYVEYLKACYRGIKRGDPEARVVLAGFAGMEPLHLEAVYRYGGKGHFDVIASHSYTRPRLPEIGGYLGKIRGLYEVMKRHGDDKPLFVTEMGWNGVEPSMLEYLRAKNAGFRAYAGTEEDQARGLARLYLLSATVLWIERVYFFHLFQEAAYTDHHHENVDWYMGLIGPGEFPGQHRTKDAYYAVKTVVAMLNEAQYVKRLDLGDDIWALVFQRGDESFIALWSLNDEVTVNLRDPSMIAGTTSMVGTPVRVSTDAPLQVTGRPVYVAAQPERIGELETALLEGEWNNPGEIKAYVELDLDRTGPGGPVLAVKIANRGRQARVSPPLSLQPPPPWRTEVPWIEDRQPLAAGETRRHLVALSGPKPGPGEVNVALNAAFAERRPADEGLIRFHYMTVPFMAGEVAIDGQLPEWPGIPAVTLGDDSRERELAGWRGPDDCSVTWHCAWNGRALFWAAAVRDDHHAQPNTVADSGRMWEGDSVQIALDTAGDAEPPTNNPLGYDGVNDVEFGLALADDGQTVVHFWFNPAGPTGAATQEEAVVTRDEVAKITRYEVAIPWSLLGLDAPPAGRWMGMNVLVNDNDGDGRRGWLEWAPGIGYEKNAAKFPKVLLGSN